LANIFRMGPSPHVRTSETVDSVMYDVVIALIPALVMAYYVFGIKALITPAFAVGACVITEMLCGKLLQQDNYAFDGSAVITGLLLAMILPPNVPVTLLVVGAIVSIALGKMVFGGTGHNMFNPALVGRAFMQASWPLAVTSFMWDGKSGATVLTAMKLGNEVETSLIASGDKYMNAFLGQMGGSLGEVSAAAILLGGIYLIYKKHIEWKVPVIIIGTVYVITMISGADPLMHILSGGLFLGAFFMATDMATSPYTPKGKMVFALVVGILIGAIRIKGGYPEGTMYAILLANGFVPLINRYTTPKKFGTVKA
jgi:Na+-translocating ferredoxin:NAD+ oxidoreductase subunit D